MRWILLSVLLLAPIVAHAEDFLAERVICEKHRAVRDHPNLVAAPGSQYEAGFDGADKCDGVDDRARKAQIDDKAANDEADKAAFSKALNAKPSGGDEK